MSTLLPGEYGGMGLEEVLEQVPAAVVIVDSPARRIVYANARARRMTEQLGRAIPQGLTEDWQIFHPDGRPYRVEEWPLVRSITSGEDVVDEEYFSVLADGTRLMIRCTSSPIYDGDRRIVGGALVMTDVTDQRAQQERLAHLAGLLDNTEDAIVSLDPDWFVTVWNKGAERMYGWTADEVVGRHTLDVARLEMSDDERAEVRRAVAERGRWRGEVVAHRKDGTALCVEFITVALRGERGEIIGYLGIHRDVTERKRTEEALADAQRRSEAILESMSEDFFAVDREWRYTYVNERALAQARTAAGRDLTREELFGMTLWELLPQHVGTTFDRELHRAMRERTVVAFESYSEPTGRWLEVRVYPTEDGLAGFSHDISERKAALEEMNRRAEQQALVADLGQRALASEDLQGLFDEALGLVARTLDVELAGVAEMPAGSEEVILRAGLGWREGVVGSRIERGGRDSQVGYTLLRGEPVIAVNQAADPRFKPSALGQAHGVVSALTVMVEGSDEPFGVLGALSTRQRTFSPSDVSFVQSVANVLAGAVERSRAQERLIEVRDAERLRIARDLHDEALQDLAHAMALAGRARPATGVPDDLTEALKRVGEHLRGAIYDLRLAGEQDTPFRELLEALVAAHRARAVDGEITLDFAEGAPGGPLGATGIEVLRILGEALTNARRHARAHAVGVRIWASAATLHAEVSDDGRGFDPAGPPPRVAARGMTGMRERAELIHGNLNILSDPEAGTTVQLEVPLEPVRDRTGQQVRVLLVEDHTAVLQAIAAMFDREPDFTVVGQARSLAEARALLDRQVDVAVLDLGLPDGDGAELIADLRTASPGVEVLVLSGALDRAQMARAIDSGAAAALDKTAHLDEVVDAVRRLRAGQTLLTAAELADLLRFAGRRREQERDDRQAIDSLTNREREVLRALGAGLDSQAIADQLNISIRTERNHVGRILSKLGVHSQLQAVLFALRYGVIGDR